MQTYKFINPYNFIPLQDKKNVALKDESARKEETYTGVIEYSLLTKTPLFITNGNSTRKYEKDDNTLSFYDFCSYEDHSNDSDYVLNPVIPGHKIKGMFRSNYEILSNSCMPYLDKEEVYNRRSLSKFERGIIRAAGVKDGKRIYELYDNAENVNPILKNLDVEALDRNLSKFEVQSYVRKTDLQPKDDSPEEKERIEKLRERIEKVTKRADKIRKCKKDWDEFKEGKASSFPVYYRILTGEMEEDYIMLSFEPFTREVYKNKYEDVIGNFGPCTSEEFCPACSLFGRPAITSKLRFTDLQCAEDGTETLFEEIQTFPVARIPRSKSAEFYLKKPSEEARFWTFDYWIDGNGGLHRQEKDTPLINGRKFYWHQMEVQRESAGEYEKKCLVRPVKKDVRFTGKLYFDKITLQQLNELIYLMNAGDYEELDTKTHGYKLGRGKPLGYGSVAVSVDKVILRQIVKIQESATRKATIEFVDNSFELNDENIYFSKNIFDSSIKESFEKITNFYILEEYIGDEAKVSYPVRVEDGKEQTEREKILAWFGNNHIHDEETGYDTYIEYLEPLSPFLQKLEKADDTKNG